jgi:hypothetical protein
MRVEAIRTLKQWVADHWMAPYMNPRERRGLSSRTGMSPKQVADWLRNERKRIWTAIWKRRMENPRCKYYFTRRGGRQIVASITDTVPSSRGRARPPPSLDDTPTAALSRASTHLTRASVRHPSFPLQHGDQYPRRSAGRLRTRDDLVDEEENDRDGEVDNGASNGIMTLMNSDWDEDPGIAAGPTLAYKRVRRNPDNNM